uniref:Globin domain-containing protein n=1 Tax=Nyssomyia neivai TaxID=330878 RepID=A0A1L8DC55_9DIPT
MPSLTPEQIEIVKCTWECVAKAPEDSGVAILLRFFEKYSHNQKYFPFRNVPFDELKDNSMFRSHGGRVIAVFQKSVDALSTNDPMGTLQEIWTEIAKTHFRRHIKQESFNELQEVILEILTAACNLNEEQQTAWTVTLAIIFEIIRKELDCLAE